MRERQRPLRSELGVLSPAATPGPGHEEGRARRQSHAVPAAAGRGRLAPRESEERLREELREPPEAGPSARLLLPPLPLLQRGAAAAAAGLPPAAAARLPLPRGAPRAGRPGRLCPRPAARLGARGLGCRRRAPADPAARLLAQPQPPLQHRLCLLLPHLLPDPGQAGPQPRPGRRRRLLVAAGSARLLLPGGLLGVAVVVRAPGGRGRGGRGPAHAPGGGGQVVPGAELRGLADARAPAAAPPQHPAAALLQPRLVGPLHRPRLAALRPPAAAVLPGRGRRLPVSPGLGSLLSNQGSFPSPSAVRGRGREGACGQTPQEVQLRVVRGNLGHLPGQLQNVQETVVALHFQGTDDSLGLGLKAMV